MAQRITLLLLSLIYSSFAWGQLEIQVTRGIDNPTSIAIAPFAWDGLGTSPVDLHRLSIPTLRGVVSLVPLAAVTC